jgi:hypothetical protein
MNTKKIVLDKFKNKYASINLIVSEVQSTEKSIDRKTVVWAVNDLVKNGFAERAGRGVYRFSPKKEFSPHLSNSAATIADIISNQFKYLTVIISESSWLNEFMVQQPFSSVVALEVLDSAVNSVVSKLRAENFEAFPKADFKLIETYTKSAQLIIVSKALQTTAIKKQQKLISIAKLEKLLVDIVCDPDIYGQYQGWELENIYRNSIGKYAINFSQMLKYATNRGRKCDVEKLLNLTEGFSMYKGALK